MENSEFVDRARDHRSSGAALKVRVSNVRSRNPTAIIAVVEGPDDVGPYEVWISRISDTLSFELVPGAGKSQLLDFRRRMANDRTGLFCGTYLFVDRDFDGLRGQEDGADIFCTEAYSMENYLVSTAILKSILTDEFRCTGETDHREYVLNLFSKILTEFNVCIADANRRIFCARCLGIHKINIEDRISRYVEISVFAVRKLYDEEQVKKLITLDRELLISEIKEFDRRFELLDPLKRYRGKFLLSFFKIWLSKLADERRRCGQSLFPKTASDNFSAGNLSLRSLASRAPLPGGLEQFVQNMKGI